MKPSTFNDRQLGLITVRINSRARHIIMRPHADGVTVTIPPYTPQHTLLDTLEQYREKLHTRQQALKQAKPEDRTHVRLIDQNFKIENDIITLTLEIGTRNTFYSKSGPGQTTIICPPNTPFEEPECQQWIHRVIEQALKQQAQRILPEHLRALSALHDLPFNQCKVNVSKGRWGSCSARKDINLSCYLAILPAHLREYVMLHELCHTREMNHSPRFWTLLDSITSGRAKELRNELKKYNTGF